MKQFTVLIYNFLFWLLLLPFNSGSQEKLDLFIWAGQSNAQGWMGDAANYPVEGKELDKSILFNWTFVDSKSSGGEWGMMQPQAGRFPSGHFGPEVSFSRELIKADYNPAIFKYSKGSTSLAFNWQAPGEGGLDSENYHKQRYGIRNSLIKFQREKRGRVAFLGGSITHNGGWRDSICIYLQKRFPDTDFEFIAAGIPSMGSTPAAFRLERDVLAAGPVDLLFEEAAVNDAVNGRSSQEQIRAMEGIVRHVRRENPATDIVIMHFVDPQKMETYRSGQVPEVIQNHEKVAAHYGLPTINLAREVTDRIDAGEFTWEDDFKDLHPSPFGQGIYSRSMITFLEKAWSEDVAEGDEILAYPQPEPLDRACYENGKLILAENAIVIQGWKMVENWNPEDGKGTRANYVNVPMLVGQHEGSLLEFRFTGNAVGIAVAAGPDAGIIEYQVDDGNWIKQDLFTRSSMNLHLPRYYALAADLSDGNHTLKLRIAGDKNPQSIGTACRIRYFFVNE